MKRRDLLRGLGAAILLGPSVVREVLAAAPAALTGPQIRTGIDLSITVGGIPILAIAEAIAGVHRSAMQREIRSTERPRTEAIIVEYRQADR